MTETGVEEAVSWIEREHAQEDAVLVIYLPDLHESLAGIVAGRIRERYYRPTLVLTDAREGVKGFRPFYPRVLDVRETLPVQRPADPGSVGIPWRQDFPWSGKTFPYFAEDSTSWRIIRRGSDREDHDRCADAPFLSPPGFDPAAGASGAFRQRQRETGLCPEGRDHPEGFYIGKQKQYLKFVLETENGCRMDGLYFGTARPLPGICAPGSGAAVGGGAGGIHRRSAPCR